MQSESITTYPFCAVNEVKTAGTITKWVDELRDEITAVFRAGKLQVFSSICPHFGGEFKYDLQAGEARCKWHDWCFDLNDGQCKNRTVGTRLRFYEFSERDGMIVIHVK